MCPGIFVALNNCVVFIIKSAVMIFILNLLSLAPKTANGKDAIDFLAKKCQEEKSRSFDKQGKLNMIAKSKVYQT